MKNKYYNLNKILNKNAHYNIIIGERSNGKTYAVLEYALKKYVETGEQLAILRRWKEDFTGKRGQQLFNALENNGLISKLTGGEWSNIYYYSSRWFLCRYENDKRIQNETPFAFGFNLSSMEHDKSTSYPNVTTILFDEFLTRSMYLPDEFVLYMNTLSTIIRERNNVKIFMLGNTVNKYCPYFKEMGLNHVKNMHQGDIDVYQYGETGLMVAVEYCHPLNRNGKQSDLYFAFDNPKLRMIKSGTWEIDIYPHCPVKYKPIEILFTYFIKFNENILQCEIIQHGNTPFTYIHQKTTELKAPDTDLIFSNDVDVRYNWRTNILKPILPVEKKILKYFTENKVFYQDNETGEIVRNYLNFCKTL